MLLGHLPVIIYLNQLVVPNIKKNFKLDTINLLQFMNTIIKKLKNYLNIKLCNY